MGALARQSSIRARCPLNPAQLVGSDRLQSAVGSKYTLRVLDPNLEAEGNEQALEHGVMGHRTLTDSELHPKGQMSRRVRLIRFGIAP